MKRLERKVLIRRDVTTIWPLLSDTDKLNREMGLPAIKFTILPQAEGGSIRRGQVAIAGLTVSYTEEPFEWERHHYYKVKRTFDNGPLLWVEGGISLESIDGFTQATVFSEAEAKPGMQWVANAFLADAVSKAETVCQSLNQNQVIPFEKQRKSNPANRNEGVRCATLMCGFGAKRATVDTLLGWIEQEAPANLTAIRPFAVANELAVDSREMAITMLCGVRAGLLDLRWRVLCPNCRGNRQLVGSLSDLEATYHCESCRIQFDSHYDKNVELIFRPSASYRVVDQNEYCIAGPMTTQHVVSQWRLAPGESRQVCLQECQQPVIKSLQVHAEPVALSSFSELRVRISADSISVSEASNGSITLENTASHPVTLQLEDSAWKADILSAHEASLLPEMRQWFSSEILSPNREMQVSRVAILFSDLCDSTKMYEEIGDAPSFGRVQAHFELMKQIVATQHGVIVKTIGDAVMAAFPTALEATEASMRILKQVPQSGLAVKLGLHEGPALVMTCNGISDYFGATVNRAAKLQKGAGPNEAWLSERAFLSQPGLSGESVTFGNGIAYRLRLEEL
ncbi:MAG: DUF5939 domain-containing protein [Fimbriimonadaceae bacterium]